MEFVSGVSHSIVINWFCSLDVQLKLKRGVLKMKLSLGLQDWPGISKASLSCSGKAFMVAQAGQLGLNSY